MSIDNDYDGKKCFPRIRASGDGAKSEAVAHPDAEGVCADGTRFSLYESSAAKSSELEALRRDAERWRTALRFVGGELSGGWRQLFHFEMLPIAKEVNIMRGGVSEHFTDAIDAAIAAKKEKGE